MPAGRRGGSANSSEEFAEARETRSREIIIKNIDAHNAHDEIRNFIQTYSEIAADDQKVAAESELEISHPPIL